MRHVNWLVPALLLTFGAGAEARAFRAAGVCPVGPEATREDAVRIAFLYASESVREQVAACLDSLSWGRGESGREELRAFVAGLVEVRSARVREERDSAVVEGVCEVDPETLLHRIGEIRRDPALSRDLALALAETDHLRTRLSEQSTPLSPIGGKDGRERMTSLRGETLANLEAKALLTRARVAFETAPSRALSLVDSALALAPRSAEARLQRGILQHQSGDLDEAIREYRTGLGILPEDRTLRFNLASALKEKGDLDAAVGEYRRILEISPRDPETSYALAGALKDRGNLRTAITMYRRTLQLTPDFVPARADLGTALHLIGDMDSAIVEYRRVLDANAKDVRVRFNLGTALKDLGRIEEAIQELQAVLLLDPGFADAHFNLGAALAEKGDRPGVLREMRAVLSLSRDDRQKASAREVIQAFGGAP